MHFALRSAFFLRSGRIKLSLHRAVLNFCARYYRVLHNDPNNMSGSDLGRLYDASMEDIRRLQFDKLLPKSYRLQIDTLNECLWMCRESVLNVICCLKAVRETFPSLRIVLWGKFGTGKSLTMCQAVHYAYTQNWVLFVIPDVMDITRCEFDIQMSTYRPGRVNCPHLGKTYLENFKHSNALIWDKLSELKTVKDYLWSQVDKTGKGRPITDIVEMGISTPYASTDCLGALIKELKMHCNSGRIRMLVAIDTANSLYGKTTVRRADRTLLNTTDLAMVHSLRKLVKSDWNNGCCILVADKKEKSDAKVENTFPLNTPLELFGEEGLDAIEPFIPIQTVPYSINEINSMYDYYKDKRWIVTDKGRSEEGRKQLMYLSVFNPFHFERMCAFL